MTAMCRLFVRRINKERYKLGNWDSFVVTSYKLKDSEITAFVTSILPIVLLAMFSKNGPQDAKVAIQHLAPLRPELVIPPLLDRFLPYSYILSYAVCTTLVCVCAPFRTYPALQNLTEPHRLIACLHCIVAAVRPMMRDTCCYPEGRKHIIPILNLCVPGIDPNDAKKTMVTSAYILTCT